MRINPKIELIRSKFALYATCFLSLQISCKVNSISEHEEQQDLAILSLAEKYNITDFNVDMLPSDSAALVRAMVPVELVLAMRKSKLDYISVTYPDSIIFFAKKNLVYIEGYLHNFSKTENGVETYADTIGGREVWQIKDRWYYLRDSDR